MAEELRSIRVHGKGTHKYDNARIGVNGRLDTIQAAILLAKLDVFAQEIDRRQQLAKQYTEWLSDHPNLITPCVLEGHSSAWAQYSLLARDSSTREKL